jgi:thiol-disulfide isomerase/thioredoxin
MPFLVTAVVLLFVLCLVNLTLTFGVIRRLRQPGAPIPAARRTADHLAMAGSIVGAFAVRTVDGTPMSPAGFTAPTLVGFFAPGCAPCADLLPAFLAVAAHREALAVVDDGTDDTDYVTRLSAVAPVARAEQAALLIEAFRVTGFPAVCLVGPGGVILDTGAHLLAQPLEVPA